MGRPKRIHIPGAMHHVMLRGNDGQDIFFSAWDQQLMCRLLQEGIATYGHRIHAFCFMNNHIHLLLQVGTVPLSKIMHNLAFRYSQKVNFHKERIGHLFQGRYKAIRIDEKGYFLRLLRYIHMNPVRAHLVQQPEQYLWSSHRAYLGEWNLPWLTCKHALGKFAPTLQQARLNYVRYILQQEHPFKLAEIRGAVDGSELVERDEFTYGPPGQGVVYHAPSPVKERLPLQRIMAFTCEACAIEVELLLGPGQSRKASLARAIITSIASENGMYTLEEIGRGLRRDGSTLSSLLSRFRNRCQKDREAAGKLEWCRRMCFAVRAV
jgi:putative transposase